MTIIYVISVIFLLVVMAFTWKTLETIEVNQKIIFLIFGIALSIFITIILFNISSSKVGYYNNEMKQITRKIIVMIFTPINAIAFMPFLGKQISKYELNKINQNKLIKNLIILAVILLIVFMLEIKYLNYMQNGIMEIIEGLVNNK